MAGRLLCPRSLPSHSLSVFSKPLRTEGAAAAADVSPPAAFLRLRETVSANPRDAEYWSDRAIEAREAAETMHTEAAKRELLEIVAVYQGDAASCPHHRCRSPFGSADVVGIFQTGFEQYGSAATPSLVQRCSHLVPHSVG
jgi:hypothetical protein